MNQRNVCTKAIVWGHCRHRMRRKEEVCGYLKGGRISTIIATIPTRLPASWTNSIRVGIMMCSI